MTASNSSDYTLSGTDRNGNISGSDPDLTFSVGDTISFVVNASGHPFYLKTAAGTGTGDTISGLTNNGTTKCKPFLGHQPQQEHSIISVHFTEEW